MKDKTTEQSFVNQLKKSFQITVRSLSIQEPLSRQRYSEIYAWLMIGMENTFYPFFGLSMIGSFPKKNIRQLSLVFSDWILYELAKKQSSSIEQDKPTHKFIQKLYSLIESGQVVLLDRDNPFDFKPVNYIGYQDNENYYLNADIAHKQVKRLCNEQDEAFSISKERIDKSTRRGRLDDLRQRQEHKVIMFAQSVIRHCAVSIKDKADAVAALAQ